MGQIANADLHDSNLASVVLEPSGAMELGFRRQGGGYSAVRICGNSKPVMISFGQVMPLTVAAVSVRIFTTDGSDFRGILTPEDLKFIREQIADSGRNADWLLFVEPVLGNMVVVAGEGRYEEVLSCFLSG